MKKNWGKLLAVALVLCLVGAFGASLIQSNFGSVEITDVVIRTSAGEYTGYLFVPENATAEDSLNYQIAYDAAIAANEAWLTSDEVRTKRIAAVNELILEEEALEGMFEGTRFYDLMRYSMATGNDAYLGERVSERNGKDNVDAALKSALSTRAGWYLPKPER